MELFDEATRRATFKKWIFSNSSSCSADKLAEAGFIFTGSSREPDSVECFFCKKALDGWLANDDPWAEHLKHAPDCEFAKLQKPQDSCTLEEYLDLQYKFKEVLLRRKFNDAIQEVRHRFAKLRTALSSKK